MYAWIVKQIGWIAISQFRDCQRRQAITPFVLVCLGLALFGIFTQPLEVFAICGLPLMMFCIIPVSLGYYMQMHMQTTVLMAIREQERHFTASEQYERAVAAREAWIDGGSYEYALMPKHVDLSVYDDASVALTRIDIEMIAVKREIEALGNII